MKQILCFCISLILMNAVNAQTDTTLQTRMAAGVREADLLPYASDTFKLEVDSMLVDIKFNSEKIHTESVARRSGRKITIDYYTTGTGLRYIRIEERDPVLSKNLCLTHYYFLDNKVSKVERQPALAGEMKAACMAPANLAFLENYMMRLYFDIYTQQTPAKLER